MKEIIRNNFKALIFVFVIAVFDIAGITYALSVSNSKQISYNITTSPIDVNIAYDTGVNGAEVSSVGKMLPISDSAVTGINVSDQRVVKAKFKVSGTSSNPENTIYDVVLRDVDIDCALRTEDVKWRLYKGSTLISEGNFSPEFDAMTDDRMVLTTIQQDLTTSFDEYTFLLWISENCSDLANCNFEDSQNKYLNKSFSGILKVEVSTKSKKPLERPVGSYLSCEYGEVEVPLGMIVTYNGHEQILVKSGKGYTLSNNSATNAGRYNVTATLDEGLKWSDGTTEDKIIVGFINKKNIVITANDKNVIYGAGIISDSPDEVSVSNIVYGHRVSSVTLNTTAHNVGSGALNVSNASIMDSNNNDVTNNYNISYVSGVVNISCSPTAVEPTVTNRFADESELNGQNLAVLYTGVSGGTNVTIGGTFSANTIGTYQATATPTGNYCWSDGTSDAKTYTWRISKNAYVVSYNTNGGNEFIPNQTKTYGVALQLSGIVPTKSGKEFLGWSTSIDATSPTYPVGGLYTANADVTLYAVWGNFSGPIAEYISSIYEGNTIMVRTTNNGVSYDYANIYEEGGLMKDRLGGTAGINSGNIRYYGANPDNYIYFNCSDYSNQSDSTCETWRIIGVFDGKVKLVRNEALTDRNGNFAGLAWDQQKNIDTGSTEYSHNWHTSSLQEFLNNGYYYGSSYSGGKIPTAYSYFSGSSGSTTTTLNLSSIGLKNTETRNKIARTTWNLGGWDSTAGIYSNELYQSERGNAKRSSSSYSTTWTGRVGLMYPSDYGYATDFNQCSSSLYGAGADCDDCNYLYRGENQWFITPMLWGAFGEVTALGSFGIEGYDGVAAYDSGYGVVPTLYLTSNQKYADGTGTEDDPYRLAPDVATNAASYISNLYNSDTKTSVSNNGINYKYATNVSLMNDRLGGNAGVNSGNIRYYGANPNNYVDIGDFHGSINMWETLDKSYMDNFENLGKYATGNPAFTINSPENCNLVVDVLASCQAYEELGFSSRNQCLVNLAATINQFTGGKASSVEEFKERFCVVQDYNFLWRIIGVFDGKLKLIRDEAIGIYSWDNKNEDSGAESDYGKNDWTTARIMKLLNPSDYYTVDVNDNGYGQSLYWNSDSGMCFQKMGNNTVPCDFRSTGISTVAKQKVAEVTWNLGGMDDTTGTYPNQVYLAERGNNVISGRESTWTGKVGLAYVSDYGYATDFNSCNYGIDGYSNNADCLTNNWFKVNSWTMTPVNGLGNLAVGIDGDGNGGAWSVYSWMFINPVIYLKSSEMIISGRGTITDPYVIN